jgi:hypothetical protein
MGFPLSRGEIDSRGAITADKDIAISTAGHAVFSTSVTH